MVADEVICAAAEREIRARRGGRAGGRTHPAGGRTAPPRACRRARASTAGPCPAAGTLRAARVSGRGGWAGRQGRGAGRGGAEGPTDHGGLGDDAGRAVVPCARRGTPRVSHRPPKPAAGSTGVRQRGGAQGFGREQGEQAAVQAPQPSVGCPTHLGPTHGVGRRDGRVQSAHHRPPAGSRCSGRARSARCPWAAPRLPSGPLGRSAGGEEPGQPRRTCSQPPPAAAVFEARPTAAEEATTALAPRRPSRPREARAWPSRRRPHAHPPPPSRLVNPSAPSSGTLCSLASARAERRRWPGLADGRAGGSADRHCGNRGNLVLQLVQYGEAFPVELRDLRSAQHEHDRCARSRECAALQPYKYYS
eukprot:COSAG04_NODE_1582_length_6253_cov_2.139422_4_plen_363_part_00